MNKKLDFIVGMLFAAATAILIVLFMTNDSFLTGHLKDTIMY